MELINVRLVDLDLDAHGENKALATDRLISLAATEGRATDVEALRRDVAAREQIMPTGIEGGIGIPHARSTGINQATVVFGRSQSGIDWGAPDGPANLIFLITVPEGAGSEHLEILASLSRSLMKADFRNALLTATDPQFAVDTIIAATTPASAAPAAGTPAPAVDVSDAAVSARGAGVAAAGTAGAAAASGAAPGPAPGGAATGDRPLRFVGVTSCPTGIAHTFMAAESLEQTVRAAGHEIQIETQGSGGFAKLDPSVIAAADGVIFAHDVEVRDPGRFSGKPTVDVGVKRAINDAPGLLAEAIAAVESGVVRGPAVAGAGGGGMATKVEEGGFGSKLRGWLMTGVSYMIPFVAAGGILIALSFLLGGYEVVYLPGTDANAELMWWPDNVTLFLDQFDWGSIDNWAFLMFVLGQWAFAFLLPVLAGFIAYAMADRPGLVVGFVGGYAAGQIGAGFLGALVAGLLGGAIALGMQRVNVPKAVRGVMPVVVIPLFGAFINGALMLILLGGPIANASEGMQNWLTGLGQSGWQLVLLGAIIGLMMAFDMGGPINKAAYAFGLASVADAVNNNLPSDATGFKVMAAVMAAGMVPPLAMALSTRLRPALYTESEREQGNAAWLLGASFITEGAIPFAAADPVRVIPAIMVGSATTGGLCMVFGTATVAPHGGVWVAAIVTNAVFWILAIIVGAIIGGILVTLAKSATGASDAEIVEKEAAHVGA